MSRRAASLSRCRKPPPTSPRPAPANSKPTRAPRPAVLHLSILAGLALLTLLLTQLALLLSRRPSLRATLSLYAPLTPRRSDPRARRLAARAVRRLLGPHPARIPDPLLDDDHANFRLLVAVARIPPVFASRLGPHGRRALLTRLAAPSDGVLAFDHMPRVLVVDVQNGLGNRLRALGSALEFAFYTGRVLVVLWAPDAHINATMSDLFDRAMLDNLIVIDHPIAWPVDPADCFSAPCPNATAPNYRRTTHVPDSFRYFSLMPKDSDFRLSSTRIANVTGMHVYVKTAYVLNSEWTPANLTNAFIQALRPAAPVLQLVRDVEHRAGGPAALRAMIGVHIRSRTILHDNDNVDHECEYSVDGAALTDRWRQMSTPGQFIPEMHRIRRRWANVVTSSYALTPARHWSASAAIARANSDVAGGPAVPVDLSVSPRFFVSADSVETLKQLYTDFERDDIIYLPRDCDDRGAACILYAYADIIVLSRTGAMLASGWSSFSEAAARLRIRPFGMDPSRNDGYVIRTSGIDFGTPSTWQRTKLRWKKIWRLLRFPVEVETNLRMSQEERRTLCRERREKGTAQRTTTAQR